MKALPVVTAMLLCWTLLAPPVAHAQRQAPEGQMRFRNMDTDHDGVITRAEWRGSDQAFRRLDKNNDGVLSGDEIWDQASETDLERQFHRADRDGDGVLERGEWWGDAGTFDRIDQNRDERLSLSEFLGEQDRRSATRDRGSFASLDLNGNGVITQNEWPGRPEEFVALDADRDGVISRSEYGRLDSAAQSQSAAYRAGRERGLADGRQAGREDRTINGGKWDLEGQRELENADAGYQSNMGSRADYQAGYRAGFRVGYRDGFGPR
jgi:Ca2+-binding EF-hand superfamily protein